MPNWCYNKVTANKKVLERLLDDKGKVTFENLVPIPLELKSLDAYSNCDTQTIEALLNILYIQDDSKLKSLYTNRYFKDEEALTFEEYKAKCFKDYPMTQLLTCKSMKDKYKCFDWYNWNCSNWGCKWDASNDFTPDNGYNPDVDEFIEFMTPWSPPEGVVNALASELPDEELVWHVDEESCAFSIDYIFNGDGTYREENVFPEYFTPYIPTQEDLYYVGMDTCTSLKEAKAIFKDELGEANYDVNVESLPGNKCNVTLTVYDWDANGGDEYYSHTWEGLDNDA